MGDSCLCSCPRSGSDLETTDKNRKLSAQSTGGRQLSTWWPQHANEAWRCGLAARCPCGCSWPEPNTSLVNRSPSGLPPRAEGVLMHQQDNLETLTFMGRKWTCVALCPPVGATRVCPGDPRTPLTNKFRSLSKT